MRRALLPAAVALASIFGGYALYWHIAAGTLADGIERWAAERRAEGYEVAYGAPAIGGFPFRLEARLENPVIGSPVAAPETGGQRWRWAGPRLTLRARPWTPLDADASAPGRHDLEIWNADARRHFVLDAREAAGQASFGTDGKVTAASARFVDLLIAESDGEDRSLVAETASIAVQRGVAQAGDHTQPSLEFQLALGGLVLPPDAETPLGREVEALEVTGAVLGRIDAPGTAAGDARPDARTDARLRDALARWRDDGGTLDLARAIVRWGELHLSGSGTFALDAALQPIGAMSTTISGHDAVIDALVADGVVTARDGGLAKILLAVLSRPSPVDGAPELTAPLTFQDGYLWVGPARLVRLPVIDWP